MRGRIITEIGGSFRGMHIRNIADITPNWKSIRNAYIMPNWSDICSTADIPKLYAIGLRRAKIHSKNMGGKNGYNHNM